LEMNDEINAATGSAMNAPIGPAIAPPARADPKARAPFNSMVFELSLGLSQ